MQDFKRHIKEAIELNTKRLPLYATLTDNQSIPFSKQLIFYEKLILSSTWLVDLIGDRYQRKGIPFIIEDFIEMNLVPEFSDHFPAHIPFANKLQKFDVNHMEKDLKRGISIKRHERVVNTTINALHQLQVQPHVYCMTRHLIESIQRIAFLIPHHESKAIQLGIKPPTLYSWFLIKQHIRFLKKALNFDEKVAFIQEQGIPFIYQDLPSEDIINIYKSENDKI